MFNLVHPPQPLGKEKTNFARASIDKIHAHEHKNMVKPVLFLQNITVEGPGLLEMFLTKRNIPSEIRDLYAETALPADVVSYGSVVILGGPMNVEEESQYPFLKAEKELIVQCIKHNVPVLGICLGAQMLARVLGANVYKNEYPEIGRMEVELTEDGVQDPLFKGVTSPLPVFQWHGDTFTLPREAVHLAYSINCRHQAFSVRERFYGLQFHLEIVWDEAVKWASEYMPNLTGFERDAASNIQKMTAEDWPEEMGKSADRIMANFFGSISGYTI